MNQAEEIVKEITDKAEWLVRSRDDKERRLNNAADAGARLAAEVYRFTQDPEAVGTKALEAAYGEFMGQHSASFTDSARAASAV